jgi:hypothetical protein
MTEQTLRRRERKNAQTRQALATTQRSVCSGEGLRPGQRQEITDAVDITVPTHH